MNPISRGVQATAAACHSAYITYKELPRAQTGDEVLENLIASSWLGCINFTNFLVEDKPEEINPLTLREQNWDSLEDL